MGYPGLNGGGEIFPIAVINDDTGEVYASYCAHAGSQRFAGDNHLGCSGYLVAGKTMPGEEDALDFASFIAAYNFIEDTYGALDANRVITQTVTWVLLGAVDVDSPAFAAANLSADESAAVKAAYAAAIAGYAGEGTIVDLVYMLCENPRHDYLYCQPQLVPVYGGEPSFNNIPKTFKGEGTLEVFAEVKAFEDEYEWVQDRKTIKDTIVTYVGRDGNNGHYMDGRGFTAIAVDVANGGTFELAYSGSGNPKAQDNSKKIGVFFTVEVVGGQVVITFDDSYISSSITAKAYSSKPTGNVDNSHHQNNTSGVLTLDLPGGVTDTVYLVIHIESITFYAAGTGRWIYIGDKEVPYVGSMTLVVEGPDGFYYEDNDFDGAYVLYSADTGEYVVTLSSNDGDFADLTETVTVVKDETATVDFGTIEVRFALGPPFSTTVIPQFTAAPVFDLSINLDDGLELAPIIYVRPVVVPVVEVDDEDVVDVDDEAVIVAED